MIDIVKRAVVHSTYYLVWELFTFFCVHLVLFMVLLINYALKYSWSEYKMP